MKNQIRAFVGIPIAPSVRGSIEKLMKSLRNQVDGVKWIDTQNLHVTLKFLGDVPMNELHRIIAAVEQGAASAEAFDLEFCGCGVFPDRTNPKTIWIGTTIGSEELTTAATAIENELFKLGYPKENRRFSPHLTIGRAKRDVSVSETLSTFLDEKKEFPFGSFGVDEVVVYSSELTRNGPIYDELATIPLR